MHNWIHKVFFIVVFVAAGIAGHEYKTKTYPVMIVIPNNFQDYIRVIEDTHNFDLYHGQAYENFGVLEYNTGSDATIRVESINSFPEWPHKITLSYEWVEPVVYHKQKPHPGWKVFGDLIRVSELEYQFWAGPKTGYLENSLPPQNLSDI